MVQQIQDALLRLPEVRKATGLSRAGIYRAEREGTFPKRVCISERCVAWKQSEVMKWIEARSHKVAA